MTKLIKSLEAWGRNEFSTILKSELEQLRSDVLPIAHVIKSENRLDESDLGIIINTISDQTDTIVINVGVFFAEVINCLTCGGDDGMCDEAYCELLVTLDKTTGEATFAPL